jgi:hypothetical protein
MVVVDHVFHRHITRTYLQSSKYKHEDKKKRLNDLRDFLHDLLLPFNTVFFLFVF